MNLICKITRTTSKNSKCTTTITANSLPTLSYRVKWAHRIKISTKPIISKRQILQTTWLIRKSSRCSRTKWIHTRTQITRCDSTTTVVTGRWWLQVLSRSIRSRWWGHRRILVEQIASTNLQVTSHHQCSSRMAISSSQHESEKPTSANMSQAAMSRHTKSPGTRNLAKMKKPSHKSKTWNKNSTNRWTACTTKSSSAKTAASAKKKMSPLPAISDAATIRAKAFKCKISMHWDHRVARTHWTDKWWTCGCSSTIVWSSQEQYIKCELI